jgi:hypothetical protein
MGSCGVSLTVWLSFCLKSFFSLLTWDAEFVDQTQQVCRAKLQDDFSSFTAIVDWELISNAPALMSSKTSQQPQQQTAGGAQAAAAGLASEVPVGGRYDCVRIFSDIHHFPQLGSLRSIAPSVCLSRQQQQQQWLLSDAICRWHCQPACG